MSAAPHPVGVLLVHERDVALDDARVGAVARPVAELDEFQLLAAKLRQACSIGQIECN